MRKIIILIIFLLVVVGAFFYFRKHPENEVEKSAVASGEKIPVVIVPHFNTFAEKRAEFLTEIKKRISPKTVIIVSVNHFNSGDSEIITTDKNWRLQGGDVGVDKNLHQKLVEAKIAASSAAPFDNEHGINNIIPEVKNIFAREILPIIIKDRTSKEKVDELTNWISANCQECLLVASVDFSHYQPSALAKIHDQYSIQALAAMDRDKIWQAETDSPQTLYLAECIAENYQAKNFHLYYNSNSGELAGSDDVETTSVVLGYYSDKPSEVATQPSTTFVIAGDAMFDRNVWHNFKNVGLKKIFSNFGDRVFRGVDLAILNLEGPISASAIDDNWQSGSMVFNFPPETTSVLKYLNVGAVSLANNHTANAGAEGLKNTREVLGAGGIRHFGQPEGFDSNVSLLRIGGPVPTTIIGIMALSDFDQGALSAKIKEEKSAGRSVIIFPHWGEEYSAKHVASQKTLAREWAAAGADLIIGSHPHVTEDFEIVDGRPVVYSLGNFVFDQFFSAETQQGLIVAGTISKDKITLTFLPIVEKVVKPQFMRGEEKIKKIKTVLDINSETGFKKLTSDTIVVERK